MSKNSGRVLELFVSIKGVGKKNKTEIVLNEKGIKEDKFYAKNAQRSILITSIESYLLAKGSSIEMEYGSLGENILIDINPYHLKPGDIISIGELELMITQNCTICNSLSKVDAKLPRLLERDRGVFAKTLRSGKIRKGDIVNILKY